MSFLDKYLQMSNLPSKYTALLSFCSNIVLNLKTFDTSQFNIEGDCQIACENYKSLEGILGHLFHPCAEYFLIFNN